MNPAAFAKKSAKYVTPFRYTTANFSIGKGPHRKSYRPVKRSPQKITKCKLAGCICFTPPPVDNWYIIPTMSHILARKSKASCLAVVESFKAFRIKERQRTPSAFSLAAFPRGIPDPYGITPAFLEYCMRLIKKNEKVRRAFKAVVKVWRRAKVTPANEEDLITMDPPVKAVTVIDWPSKKSYHFEASTIERCIVKQLFHHDALFSSPMQPSNPYTNIPFTFGQLHSIITQLLRHGSVHWSIGAFREHVYSMAQFKLVHDAALRLAALKSTFADPTHPETNAILYDYIDAEHQNHLANFPLFIYKWALEHALESDKILAWRALCYKYYLAQTLYSDNPTKRMAYQLTLQLKTMALCMPPTDLKRLMIRSRRIAEVSEDDL
jgi:hypothetical protein